VTIFASGTAIDVTYECAASRGSRGTMPRATTIHNLVRGERRTDPDAGNV
jgi:hypothetical protein